MIPASIHPEDHFDNACRFGGDRSLVDAVRSGDVAAFGSFYDLHAPMVYAACLRRCDDNVARAEELLESVFWLFWKRRTVICCPSGKVEGLLIALAFCIRRESTDSIATTAAACPQ